MNLQPILEYIQRNHDQVISVSDLAAISGYSPYHFLRAFTAKVGIGPARFGAMLRLHRGYYLIKYRPWLSILDIAIECGYSSSDSFSRAFKRITGYSPSAIREHDIAVTEPFSKLLTQQCKVPAMSQFPLVETVTLPAINVCVLRHQGNPRTLPGTIQQFIGWRRENRLPPDQYRTFNFIWHDPASVSPADYIFDLACEVPRRELRNMEDKQLVTIPQGRYAKIEVKGSDSELGASIDYLVNHYLAENNEQAGDFPVIVERVTFYPEVPVHEAVSHIYLLLSK